MPPPVKEETGKEATFYDGMITCSTLPGRAVCGLVWNMGKDICKK